MTDDKYLWEDIKSPEELFDLAQKVCEQLDDAWQHTVNMARTQDDLDKVRNDGKVINRAKALLKVMASRLKTQSDQMIQLSAYLYKHMPEEQLLELMLSCGITRSEMAACWDVPTQDALDAELRFKGKGQEEN